ncbi:hypothetical protein DITRI_Ditri02bG0027700 [Diplodiscus trichospermus]
MELSDVSIHQALVKEIKEEISLSDIDPYSFVSPSAYETAWLAMIPGDSNQDQPCLSPMFKDCLDWVVNNQTDEGYWGELDAHGNPTMESLPATLACVIALKKWNVGISNAERGLAFVRANAEKFLEGKHKQFSRWFTIVFPGMIELAREIGLELDFPNHLNGLLMDILFQRQKILDSEEPAGGPYPPLLSYLEALPSFYAIKQEDIAMHVSGDGSLFQSPSATARAFMATGKEECLGYLQSLVRTCADHGVPPTYPMDEELIKLGLANQLQRLGLAAHFPKQIEHILTQVYRNYNKGSSEKSTTSTSIATQLHKDPLAFRLLRMHGYDISPWSFCWFLNNREVLDQIEKNHKFFSSSMLNVYRATDLMFPGEYELGEARSFSRKVLEKVLADQGTADDGQFMNSFNLQRMIEHELSLPWMARMDHLEHRAWIEENDMNALWGGKTSFHRLSSHKSGKFVKLAAAEYEFRQSIYKNELAELKSWCLNWGLSDIGFGREKTTYCYFAISASFSDLPYDSYIRMMVAKSAIIITVADDFFDMEGCLDELHSLYDAVRRWDAKGLSGRGKVIFVALDNLVKETSAKHLQQDGTDISSYLKQIWCETFGSWLAEAEWSQSGYMPTMDEYLRTGMTSIATHTLVLPASCFLKSNFPNSQISPAAAEYQTITKLVMLGARLLNDVQSYQKEIEDGKMNSVLLFMKENPDADIDDSVAFIRELIEKKRQELLKHALMDGYSDFPMACRHLHLSCMKVFQMFYNSSNRYDSNTDMFQDIQKAIYIPLDVGTWKPLMPLPSSDFGSKKEFQTITSHHNQFVQPFKYKNKRIIGYQTSSPIARREYGNYVFITPNFRLSFA